MNYLEFNNILLQWYAKNKRDLPWRSTKNPYKVWLSEIILQQTRVNQGLSYYLNFIEKYPKVEDLAAATEENILKLWQGLGYYSRARNLHFAAKQIIEDFNGKFPKTSFELKKLKGIGEYTSAAIASFCFNEPVAVIDGNVYRVLSRLFGIETPIDSTEGIKEFKNIANLYISKEHPGEYNQAMMDFGAIQCKPVNPMCNECPLIEICEAFNSNRINELPVKAKKVKKRNRYIYYIVPTYNESTFVSKRTQNDVWKNLYEFPIIELSKRLQLKNSQKLQNGKHY